MTHTRHASRILRSIHHSAPVLVALAATGVGVQAFGAIAPSLGAAGPYAVLGVNGTTMSFAGGSFLSVNGNAGVGPGSSLNFSGGNVFGRIDKNTGSTVTFSGGNQPTGGVLTTSLTQAYTDAASAAAQIASNTPTLSYTNILATLTVPGVSGVNAVSVSGSINLGTNQFLRLSGPSDAYFIFNIAGGMSLSGAQVTLLGGATADHVLFNMDPSGSANVSIGGGSVVSGSVLAVNRNMTLSSSTLFGQFIGAGSHTLDLNSDPTVNYIAFSSPVIPAPQTAALLTGFLLFKGRSRRRG